MPDQSVLDADLCIIGAGAAGIVLARELARTSLEIVVLESGGLEIDPAVQALNGGEAIGLAYSGLEEGRSRAVGGSTKLWAGQCLPLDEIDFAPRDWVPHSGWPFVLAHLQPYYRRAEAFFRLNGEVYDDSVYRRFGLVAPCWRSDALRMQFTIYTPEVDTGRFHRRALKRAAATRVVTYATVTGITTNANGSRAERVHACCPSGRTCTVRARAFALCAGSLENARILLSSEGHGEAGLGNDRDLVGRFLQDHPNALVANLENGDAKDLQDRFRLLYARGLRFFPKYALSPERQRAMRVLNANAHLVFEYDGNVGVNVMRDMLLAARRGRLPKQLVQRIADLVGDARGVANVLRRRYWQGRSPNLGPTGIRLQCYLEQAPNPESRIQLSTSRDALGMRKIRVNWRLTALEWVTMQAMVETVGAEFQRLGLGRIRPENWTLAPAANWQSHLWDAFHPAGTTRMADSPQRGVVDPDGQVFGVAGLYLCGGSVFPTSGYANPTLTIAALAVRLGDHLRSALASGRHAA